MTKDVTCSSYITYGTKGKGYYLSSDQFV